MGMKRIFEALTQAGPMTRAELARHLGVGDTTVVRGLQRLRQRRHIHVADWRRPEAQGRMARIYAAGDAPDAPEPAPKPATQSRRESYRRHRVAISVRRYGARSSFVRGGLRVDAGMWGQLIVGAAA